MGVFAAMLTGVSGLIGQSTKMGAISDNIANVNTVGYKQVDVPFQTLVTERVTSTSYSPGGSISRPRQLIDQQGVVQTTNSSLDMAVSGNGFFIVSDDPTGGADASRLYTRAGSFRPVIDPTENTGALLRNVGGFYLMGWALDASGNTVNANPTLTDLEVVDLNSTSFSAQETTEVDWRANLPADIEPSASPVSIFGRFGERVVFNAAAGTASTTSNAEVASAVDLTISNTAGQNRIAVLTGPNGEKISINNSTAADDATNWNIDLSGVTTLQALLDSLDSNLGGAAANVATAQTDIADATNNANGLGVVGVSEFTPATTEAEFITNLTTLRDNTTTAGTAERALYDQAITAATGTGSVAAAQAAANTVATNFAAGPSFTLTSGETVTLQATLNSASQVEIQALYTPTGASTSAALQLSEFNAPSGSGVANPIQFTNITELGQFQFTSNTAANQGWANVFTSDFTSGFQVFDALGSTHNVNYQWQRRLDEPNLWEVRITNSDVGDFNSADELRFDTENPDQTGVRFAVNDGSSTGGAIFTQSLFLKFNGDGSLAEVRTTVDGQAGETAEGLATSGVAQNRETQSTETPKLISVAIGPTTTSTSGEAVATANSTFTVSPFVTGADGDPGGAQGMVFEWNVGRPTGLGGADAGTGLDGITQFDSGEAVPQFESFFFEQNGARFGEPVGFGISDTGILSAIFDNGESRAIYQIPLATFSNANGLINLSGNAFQESEASGQVQVKSAGESGAGRILGSSLEQSNVDLGDEFTDMIITQQAFTANTRTITTADRMLEELVRILR